MQTDTDIGEVPVPQTSSTLRDFCKRHSISRTMWRKLQKSGRGPKFYRLGMQKILITAAAEAAWLKARETPSKAEAEMLQRAVDELKAKSRKANAISMKSPNHIINKRRKAKAGA